MKRIIACADESNLSADFCVWAWHAELFDNVEPGTQVLIKGARVVDY